MANMKYFADHQGQTIQLDKVGHDGSIFTSAKHFFGRAPDGTKLQAARCVEFKSNPSLHKCGPRCLDAKGFICECSCGGANHGKGALVCEAV
jgi:hypothetical protein